MPVLLGRAGYQVFSLYNFIFISVFRTLRVQRFIKKLGCFVRLLRSRRSVLSLPKYYYVVPVFINL